MKYDIALDAHFRIVQELKSTTMHRQLGRYMLAIEHGEKALDMPVDAETISNGAAFCNAIRRPISQGSTMFLTSRMSSMWGEICDNNFTDLTLEPWDVIEEYGFALLEAPVNRPVDIDTGLMPPEPPVRAVSWFPTRHEPEVFEQGLKGSGLLVQFWMDSSHPTYRTQIYEYYRRRIIRMLSETTDMTVEELENLEPDDPRNIDVTRHLKEAAEEDLRRGARFVMDSYVPLGYGFEHDAEYLSDRRAVRDAILFFKLASHKKGRITGVPPSRAARRRARELPKAGEVNIIYLRQEVNRDPDLKEAVGDQRLSPRRHLVRSHYKKVWVGSGEDRHVEMRRIEAYERGVGPMVNTDRLYVLNR